MNLTPQQLTDLARFAGGTFVDSQSWDEPSYWDFPNGLYIIHDKWDPLKPEHGDLALRALVKAMAKKHKMSILWGWQKVLADLANETWNLDKRFDFWPAVCAAALEQDKLDKKGV